MTAVDTRSNQIAWAKWTVANKAKHVFEYSEGSNRMSAIGVWPLKFPITIDCSAYCTWLAWVSGAPDPNGLNFDHEGYTGTFLSHEEHIALFAKNAKGVLVEEVIPGDYVVYGPGTGEHVAFIVEVHGEDILTVSMGENGDPSYVWVNAPKTVPSQGHPVDGRLPQTFLRPVTMSTGVVHTPPTV